MPAGSVRPSGSVSVHIGSSGRGSTKSSSSRPVLIVVYVVSLVVWWQICDWGFTPTQHRGAVVTAPAVAAAAATPAPHAAASAAAASAVAPTAAPATAAPPTTTAVKAPPAKADANCPNRRPYHTLLTGQGTTYNGWQSRIMYFHWKKQAAADGPCTDMTGFTRICASKDGLPDGLENDIPSVFLRQLTSAELAKYGHFGVLNRPHSVVEFLKQPELVKRTIKEEFVMIAETDHVRRAQFIAQFCRDSAQFF
jgi:hypothetical protein